MLILRASRVLAPRFSQVAFRPERVAYFLRDGGLKSPCKTISTQARDSSAKTPCSLGSNTEIYTFDLTGRYHRRAAAGHRISGRFNSRLLRRCATTHRRINSYRPTRIAAEKWLSTLNREARGRAFCPRFKGAPHQILKPGGEFFRIV